MNKAAYSIRGSVTEDSTQGDKNIRGMYKRACGNPSNRKYNSSMVKHSGRHYKYNRQRPPPTCSGAVQRALAPEPPFPLAAAEAGPPPWALAPPGGGPLGMKETAQKEMARRWWHEEQLRSQGMPTWRVVPGGGR